MFEVIILGYFTIYVTYIFILSIAGHFYSFKQENGKTDNLASICVLVPCYKEDKIIYSVSKSLLQLDYPKENFDIIIIADSLQESTIAKLKTLSVTIFIVSFEKSTKTKALNEAFSKLNKKYDLAIINDADNIPESSFLSKINQLYQNGFSVIQGERVTKNTNTSFAILDSISEAINNHLFRSGLNALGFSSSLIGSGLAIKFELLKSELLEIDAVGGFDKILQLNLIEKGYKIHYAKGAIVFDEKVSTLNAFKNQRRRWLSSQYIYFQKFFAKGLKMLFKGKIDYFNLAVFYNLFPSRILMLGYIALAALTVTILNFGNTRSTLLWYTILVTYIISLLISIPLKFYNKRFFFSIVKLPLIFFHMILILFRLKGANSSFIHTEHTQTTIHE